MVEHNGLWAGRVATDVEGELSVIIANDNAFDLLQGRSPLPYVKDITPSEATRKRLVEIATA